MFISTKEWHQGVLRQQSCLATGQRLQASFNILLLVQKSPEKKKHTFWMSKKTMLWIKSWNATTIYLLGNAGFPMVKMKNRCEELVKLRTWKTGPLEPIDRILIGPTQSSHQLTIKKPLGLSASPLWLDGTGIHATSSLVEAGLTSKVMPPCHRLTKDCLKTFAEIQWVN